MFEFSPSNQILYEDNHLLILNKYPTQIVQGDKTGDRPLSEYLKTYIKEKYNKPGNVFLGVVHRIDRPSSGTVIFARTSKALARLNKMLKEGEIRKTYWIVVGNKPAKVHDLLDDYLWKLQDRNKSFVVRDNKPGAKQAILEYQWLRSEKGKHLIEVSLKTGRHHQIRVQFSHIGCPVVGDVKYGYPKANALPYIHLHARSIDFVHPVSLSKMHIEAPPPHDEIWDLFCKYTRLKKGLNC